MQLFQGINVVSIAVGDLDAGREFYANVLCFGPPLYDLPEAGWIEFSTGSLTYCSFYDPFGNLLQMCSPAPDTE
jgi:hypothetical protein